ncbi:hypothetical protein JRO89_XS03G0152900 [Xanthoceras sorbifolium]|uniref:Galactinol--sucrose galactosyltransferase n=1 Tax=Xanthoceras sorbifolium TaxID=99658 RepID=A0ABQ8IA00_9ROSI|nr:hypothetical protein JRO89_XS03G0152900 [Xanthoceras sorbifolium]
MEGVVPTVDKGKAAVENFTVVIPKPPLGKSVGPVVEQNIKAVAMHGSVNEEGPLHGFASENETLHDSVSKKEALFRTLLHGLNSKTVHEDCLGGLSHEVHSLAVASSTDSVLRGEKASSNGRRWKRRARERIEVDVDMAHKELGTKRLNPLGDAVDAQLVKKNVASRFSLSPDRNISIDGIILLSQVPDNVTLSPFNSLPHFSTTDHASNIPAHILKPVSSKSVNGAFLGLSVEEPSDRILNPVGKLLDRKFLSIFRFKTWWSTMWVGSSGSDLQMETQLVLVQVPELNSYVVIIPLIEGDFRSAIHPGSGDGDDHNNVGEVILCVESGSIKVKAKSFSSCAYFHVGANPFDVMRDAFSAVRVHLGTFRLLEEKKPPRIVGKFGWCSWDAFYLTVEPVGLWHGVKSFAENGFPPRFLIIDDGWQSINMDHEPPFEDSKDLTTLGSQMLCRLYRFKENGKFAKYQAGAMSRPEDHAPKFDQEKHDKMFQEMVTLAEKKKKMTMMIKEDHGENNCDISSLPSPKTIEYLKEEEGVERGGLGALVGDLKAKFPKLDDVYVWHCVGLGEE